MRAFKWLSVVAAASTALALTPEQLISAPSRGEAVPNPAGEVALFSTSQYSFKNHKSSSWWSLIDLKTGHISQLTNDSSVSEVVWLGNSSVLYINSTNANIPGGAEMWVSDIHNFTHGYKAASLPAFFSGLKAVTAKSGDVRYVAYGKSYANATAYNEKLASTPRSSARIYDSLYPRHWDTWLDTTSNAVFSGTLRANKTKSANGKPRYSSVGPLRNVVSGIKNAESPYPPFGGASDYALSPDGKWVAFKSKAPDLPRANFTTSYIYLVPHDGSRKPFAVNGRNSSVKPHGIDGDSSGPAFSPSSDKLAYLQMKENDYESDRRTLYVYSIGSNSTIQAVAKNWDRSPEAVKWSADGKELIVAGEDRGRTRLFSLPVNAGDNFKPRNFTDGGAVSDFYQLSNSTFLVTGSNIWTSWNVYTASPRNGVIKTLASANKIDPELKGLSPADTDEFYYRGDFTDIQSWLVYPPNFSKNETYPLLLYIHGGPQNSWSDSWSIRWNAKVFADQGYVVVAPNPTGSTGFGDALTDAIQNNWGGSPYDDLVKCWEYVRDNFNFIDTDHGVAAGASYGAFMINWIQGSDLGRKFKALVSHDGPFIGDARFNTDELWFVQRDNNGTLWHNRENYRCYDPSAPERILKFSTPMLVIHSDKDFRLPVSEGIALFNVLQERGVPSRFLNFPDESHWVQDPENSLVWHQQVLGWLNKYSGAGHATGIRTVNLNDTTIPVVNYNP